MCNILRPAPPNSATKRPNKESHYQPRKLMQNRTRGNEKRQKKPSERSDTPPQKITGRRMEEEGGGSGGWKSGIPPLDTRGGGEGKGINKAVKIQTPLLPEVTEGHNEEDGVSPEGRKWSIWSRDCKRRSADAFPSRDSLLGYLRPPFFLLFLVGMVSFVGESFLKMMNCATWFGCCVVWRNVRWCGFDWLISWIFVVSSSQMGLKHQPNAICWRAVGFIVVI